MNDLPAPQHADTLLQQIDRLVRSDIPVERVQALLDLYNQERARVAQEQFNQAMTLLQAEIFEVASTGKNPTFRTAYPKLHDLLKEARPIYTKYGFGIRYGSTLQKTPPPPLREGWQRVVIITSHNGGHWEEAFLDGPPDVQQGARARTPVQAIGSTTTYLRRYLFMMVLNLVPGGDPTDDDGAGGGDTPITAEQIAEINRLIADVPLTSEETSNLLLAMNVSAVEDIRAGDYPRVANTLINRKRRKEENADC